MPIQRPRILHASQMAGTGVVSPSNLNTTAQGGGGNKNILINGAMNVAQRYTSKASISSGDFFVVDRFGGYINAAGTWTVSQSTDTPTGQGFGNSAKFDCTAANGSLGSGAELLFRQRIEGQNLQHLKKGTSSAESVTVQFWVKSNKTGTYTLELFDNDNSGRHIGKSYTINSSNTWEKKTITFAGDTTGTLDNDNNTSMTVNWWLAAGSGVSDPSGTLQTAWGTRTDANRAVGNVNLADDVANEWYITGVQFEVGDVATAFEHEPFETTLRKCQRYLLRYPSDGGTNGGYTRYGIGYCISSTETEVAFYPPVHMRDDPSLTYGGAASTYYIWHANGDTALTSMSVEGGSTMEYIVVNAIASSGFSAGRAGSLNAYNNSTNYLQFDSEL